MHTIVGRGHAVCPLWGGCPLFGVSTIGGSTVLCISYAPRTAWPIETPLYRAQLEIRTDLLYSWAIQRHLAGAKASLLGLDRTLVSSPTLEKRRFGRPRLAVRHTAQFLSKRFCMTNTALAVPLIHPRNVDLLYLAQSE